MSTQDCSSPLREDVGATDLAEIAGHDPGHSFHRDQLIEAALSVIATDGYRAATAARVATQAGLGGIAFARTWPGGLHECLLAAYEPLVTKALETTEAASETGDDISGRLQSALDALTDLMDTHPRESRFSLLYVTECSMPLRDATIASFAQLLGDITGLAPSQAETLTIGCYQMIHHRIARRQAAPLRQLVPEMMYTIATALETTQTAGNAQMAQVRLESKLAEAIRGLTTAGAQSVGGPPASR
jgi:AcrR family transcriptional regulator